LNDANVEGHLRVLTVVPEVNLVEVEWTIVA
jgi:hypothetical protein